MPLKDICSEPDTSVGLSVIPLNDTWEEPETIPLGMLDSPL
jgi:hypothetical protein